MKSRRMRWAKNVKLLEKNGNVYRSSVGNSEAKNPLGRPRCRWEDNTKVYLKDI